MGFFLGRPGQESEENKADFSFFGPGIATESIHSRDLSSSSPQQRLWSLPSKVNHQLESQYRLRREALPTNLADETLAPANIFERALKCGYVYIFPKEQISRLVTNLLLVHRLLRIHLPYPNTML